MRLCGIRFMRRTKGARFYRRMRTLQAVRPLLGYTKMNIKTRYARVGPDDSLAPSWGIDL